MNTTKTSQITKFYKRSTNERISTIREWIDHDPSIQALESGLNLTQANHMIENVIGIYGLPLGIATHFLINQRDYLIPMVIEEPSVVAACSNAAKLIRVGGGFTAKSDEPIMIGQIQILEVPDLDKAINNMKQSEARLLAKVNEIGGSIVKRGGGARGLETRLIQDTHSHKDMLIVHLLYDTQDAMGANAINTAVEYIAPDIEELTRGRVNLKILSNLTDRRKAYAECIIPVSELGDDVINSIVEASRFAELDPYRATTHNKGVMNGIDAVVIATGNDWRAVEAGAHAYVARTGSYTSLTQWRKTAGGDLYGKIEMPLAVGIVGGATRVHPVAQLALKILGVQTARELAEVIVSVGLAQNLAAIRALATDGIQHGHMRMHAKQLAVAAGAPTEMVAQVVEQLIRENNIRLERAKNLVNELLERKQDESE